MPLLLRRAAAACLVTSCPFRETATGLTTESETGTEPATATEAAAAAAAAKKKGDCATILPKFLLPLVSICCCCSHFGTFFLDLATFACNFLVYLTRVESCERQEEEAVERGARGICERSLRCIAGLTPSTLVRCVRP